MCSCTSENLEIPGSMLAHRPGMTVQDNEVLARSTNLPRDIPG
jgi:hypothetical protein